MTWIHRWTRKVCREIHPTASHKNPRFWNDRKTDEILQRQAFMRRLMWTKYRFLYHSRFVHFASSYTKGCMCMHKKETYILELKSAITITSFISFVSYLHWRHLYQGEFELWCFVSPAIKPQRRCDQARQEIRKSQTENERIAFCQHLPVQRDGEDCQQIPCGAPHCHYCDKAGYHHLKVKQNAAGSAFYQTNHRNILSQCHFKRCRILFSCLSVFAKIRSTKNNFCQISRNLFCWPKCSKSWYETKVAQDVIWVRNEQKLIDKYVCTVCAHCTSNKNQHAMMIFNGNRFRHTASSVHRLKMSVNKKILDWRCRMAKSISIT